MKKVIVLPDDEASQKSLLEVYNKIGLINEEDERIKISDLKLEHIKGEIVLTDLTLPTDLMSEAVAVIQLSVKVDPPTYRMFRVFNLGKCVNPESLEAAVDENINSNLRKECS